MSLLVVSRQVGPASRMGILFGGPLRAPILQPAPSITNQLCSHLPLTSSERSLASFSSIHSRSGLKTMKVELCNGRHHRFKWHRSHSTITSRIPISGSQINNKPSKNHYDTSLTGLDPKLDLLVEEHKRETMVYNRDRNLKDEQAKLVAPGNKQSPVALMTINPAYAPSDKPLNLDYHGSIENLRLSNTGYFWDVKVPYQISMLTALHGAQFQATTRFRLDQFHCHWDSDDQRGSEHTVDSRSYSAEMHFVHYNMEKYRTLARAARHPDGLVVVAVFLEASDEHHNHAELEKISCNLKYVPSSGDHTIIKQGVRIENLMPQNRSYWSYEGSLTTAPYYESVTWFILKHPVKCSSSQLSRFRSMRAALNRFDDDSNILNNVRELQPMNGRTVWNYDDLQHSTHNHHHNHHYNNSNNNIIG